MAQSPHFLTPASAVPVRESASTFPCILRDDVRDAAIIRATGDVDVATAPLLKRAVRDIETYACQILDLRRVAFVDCRGLQALCDATDRAAETGGHLTLIGGPPQLARLMTVVGHPLGLNFIQLGLQESALHALFHPPYPRSVGPSMR